MSDFSRGGVLARFFSGLCEYVFEGRLGLADPPVRLLPCLLLEQLEDYARHNTSAASAGAGAGGGAILLSGQAYLYEGRNYLLPTAYRIPRERTLMAP